MQEMKVAEATLFGESDPGKRTYYTVKVSVLHWARSFSNAPNKLHRAEIFAILRGVKSSARKT